MADAGIEILRSGPLARFADRAAMAEEVEALRAGGCQCAAFDSSARAGEGDSHTAAAVVDFPGSYGLDLDASNDC